MPDDPRVHDLRALDAQIAELKASLANKQSERDEIWSQIKPRYTPSLTPAVTLSPMDLGADQAILDTPYPPTDVRQYANIQRGEE
jgi:hypothetical protein